MISAMRTHDRQNFFKYVSAGTAISILTNRTLRWSSPVLFNDPFDVPRELSFGVTSDDLIDALIRRIANLIENPPDDTSALDPTTALIVESVKKNNSMKLKAELIDGLTDVASSQRFTGESLDALRVMWKVWIPNFRILCFTESPDHVAMWYHYANQYSGVVLEFRCDDEHDSAWLLAKPVIYPKAKPDVYTAEGWARLLTMPQQLAINKILDVSTLIKSQDWSYEREWRIISFKRADDIGLFTDYAFHQNELSGIYLGPMISESDREALTDLAKGYPRAAVWSVAIGMNREFHFEAICD